MWQDLHPEAVPRPWGIDALAWFHFCRKLLRCRPVRYTDCFRCGCHDNSPYGRAQFLTQIEKNERRGPLGPDIADIGKNCGRAVQCLFNKKSWLRDQKSVV